MIRLANRLAICALALAVFASPASAQYQRTTIGSIQAATTSATSLTLLNDAATLNLLGFPGAAIQITGTWTGTIAFEVSADGTNYQAANFTPPNSTVAVASATANGVWSGSVVGFKSLRARLSILGTGTAVVTVRATLGGGAGGAGGGSAPSGTIGAAVPGTASPVAGRDNSGNLAYFKFDAGGNLLTAVTGAGSGGTSAVDGAAYVAGTTAGTPTMGAFDDAATTACAEDKTCIARLTAQRGIHVNLRTAAGVETGVAAAPLQVSLANTAANATAVKVDGSAVTQPVSVASLPSHAVTNAGTFATQAAQSGTWTVQPGNTANTTAWLVAGGKTNNNAAPGATNVGVLGGLANAAAPTFTEGDQVTASQDLHGSTRVTPLDTTGVAMSDTTAHASKVLAVDSTGTAIPVSDGGAGGQSVNTTRTVTASDSPDVATLGATTDAAATTGSTGSLSSKLRLMTTQLDAIQTAVQLIDDDQTGATATGVVSAASTNSTNVKATAGRLMGMYLTNNTTTIYYMRFYNTATNPPTCSSATNYVFTMAIPPAPASGQAGGFSMPFGPTGLAFSSGIGYCLTGGPTSTDNTNAAVGIYGVLATK